MKVTFIIGSLQSGGAERVVSTLSNYWSKKGWEITIITLSGNKSFYTLEDNVKRVLLIENHAAPNRRLQIFYTLYGLRKSIKEEKSDIVVSFMTLMNIFSLLATISLKIPIIISERNYFDQLKKKHIRWLRKLLYPYADGMVVLSQYDYEKYKNVKNKSIIVNPLNKKTLLDVKLINKEKMIISVGRLNLQKGFDMLLLALAQVNLVGWKFYIIGEGVQRFKLETLIKEYSLEENVFLLGRKTNIYDYYKRASIFVLSSRYEGFPNVLAEAMAHGCASVAFDCKTGPRDMIDNSINGLLVGANNVDELANNIQLLIDDNELRESFFSSSMEIREKLDIENISLSWENKIQNIINK